ncbi:transcriptional regulator family: Fungal Specific TF [Penicillium herquei]|nr:transcriptional regulator family: Fungal Specific TF [Penicillium herquei]
MPGVPSNKACERCKKKHLKCDETRPQCQRCTTAGAECPGYVQTRKFIDQGATVRRRYAPYQNVNSKAGSVQHANTEDVTESSSSHTAQTHTQSNTQESHGPISSNPLNENGESSREETRSNLTHDAETSSSGQLSFVTSQKKFFDPQSSESQLLAEPNYFQHPNAGSRSSRSTGHDSISPNIGMGFASLPGNTYTPNPNSRPDYPGLTSSESMIHESEKEDFHDLFSEIKTGTEHEIAFLTRHYAENIAPWLDLSDSGKFFTVYVPIRALNCLSLKYAITSLAAKQLGRVKGAKPMVRGGIPASPAITEAYPNAGNADWFLKAANYYYMSASDLNNNTSGGYTAVSSSAALESPIEIVSRWLGSRSTQEIARDSHDGTFVRKSEDILSTVTLLTLYRLLDLKGDEWHNHMSGIGSLFESLLHLVQIHSNTFSQGIRASFWNFARYDYLGSYLSRSPPYLGSENLELWRAAGISIDDQKKFRISLMGPVNSSQEDQAANGLIWILSKVVNFRAHSKQSQIAQWAGSPPSNAAGEIQTDSAEKDTTTWLDLCLELQTWFEGVPETFRPCVRIENPRDLSGNSDGAQMPFPEVFYSLPTCAAAMQHYHFGRIALLLNRPPDVLTAPSTAFDRLQGYREVTKEVDLRSREVCGIALARPQSEIRVHMTALLFAVGQCLESSKEHQIIVDLLCGIEADLGWSTDYVVQDLQSSWNNR